MVKFRFSPGLKLHSHNHHLNTEPFYHLGKFTWGIFPVKFPTTKTTPFRPQSPWKFNLFLDF